MEINIFKIKIYIFCALFLVGCNKVDKSVSKEKSILHWGFFNDIVSLDPSKCRDIMSWALLKQIFEPLLSVNEKGEIIPCLAERWSLASDNKTYTFLLKKNVKFHDGTPMSAQDVKASFERTCRSDVNSQVALQYLGDVLGADDFNAGKTIQIKGIKVLESHKIQIKLKKPTSCFLKKLTNCITGIMGAATRHKKDFLKPEDLIGTGPFVLKHYASKQELNLVAYQNYHDGKVSLDGINIKILLDPEQTLNYFREGKIDICDLSFKQVSGVKKDPVLKEAFKELDSPAVNFIAFNIKEGVWSNKHFRQAINAAIDRNLIIESIDNTAISSATLIPKNILGHRNYINNNSFNVKRAQSLLKESNIKNLSDLNLKIYTISQMPLFNSIAENIVMQLKTNLNLNATIHPLARGTFMEKKTKKELDAMLFAWTAVFMDPSNFLYDLLCSESKLNNFNYKNSKVDELLLKAGKINDVHQREKLYHQAEDIILDESPVIPLCFLKRLLLINKRVKGIQYNPMEIRPFSNVSLN